MSQSPTSGKTRVLFLIPTLGGGGAEKVIVTLLRHLDRSRFAPALAVVDTREPTLGAEVPADVPLIDLKCRRVRHAIPSIIRTIRRERPAVVFSTLGHLNLALAMTRPLLPDGIRYVARETSMLSRSMRDQSHLEVRAWAYRRFYDRLDAVICQSRSMADDLLACSGIAPDKVVVIHNPVDVERIGAMAQAPMPEAARPPGDGLVDLLAVGRLVEVKGFDLLIGAVARLRDLPLRLTILGDGPLAGELREQARALGVADRVRLLGFQPNPYPFMRSADALVLASRHEGLPNVVLEAVACGTPVITTPAHGGVREIVDAIPGCVVAAEVSAEGIATAIASWATGPRTRPRREAVEPYLLKRVVAQYEAVLLGPGAA